MITEYKLLPPVRKDLQLSLPHFPSRFHAAVFRFWETVSEERIARALDTDLETVRKAAYDMGLPEQDFDSRWERLGYITTIRNAWHLLPYDQLLTLLDMTEKELSVILKEEDFLSHKLGFAKPYCERVTAEELTDEGMAWLCEIQREVKQSFGNLFGGVRPFDFFASSDSTAEPDKSNGIRMIYSYCGLYAGVLDNDISLSYPEELLKRYAAMGINAIWLQAVLYRLVPFPFDESYSEGWQKRQGRLRELIALAGKYGISVYLYINEPRCMPLEFFEKHPELRGRVQNDLDAALCTSVPEVKDYLRYAVRRLCTDVSGLGGFFVITLSENLTHCKSRTEGTPCERCKDVPIDKLVSEVLRTIYEESTAVDKNLKTIAWTWAWDYFMTTEELQRCIDSLPKGIIIQSNSEANKPFTIGGIKGSIQDYSMSIPGPADTAKSIWQYASERGHETSAKVQVNNTWECSTVPFLPVFDLVREHMTGLREVGVKHLMLSWTLGGYPAINLKIASACLENPSEKAYRELLEAEYGEYAEAVRRAAGIFSEAFRHFPFHINTVYLGPQNAGPSNPLFAEPTGLPATMTCYCFDDLDSWRSIYPREVFIDQLKKLSDKWREGLSLISDMPDDNQFKLCAVGGYLLFYSSYLQSEFCDKQSCGDVGYLRDITKKERENALEMYRLMQNSSLIGYEAANHYYFNRGMLAEKVLNCDYILKRIK